MKQKELLKRIEGLEARIRQLEARPVYVPYAVPQLPAQPAVGPWGWWESPICGGTGTVTNWPGTSYTAS